MFYEIMNDESLAISSKSSIKVFGKCTSEVTNYFLKPNHNIVIWLYYLITR